MKNRIILATAGVLSLGLLAFGFSKWDSLRMKGVKSTKIEPAIFNYYFEAGADDNEYTDFFYDMGSRFKGISKSTIQNASTISEMLDQQEIDQVDSYKRVSIIILKNDEQTDIRESGYTDKLTESQLKLFSTFTYSTNFLIRADYIPKDKSMQDEFNSFTPHFTVVPEKQAEYVDGKDALLTYFGARNKKNTKNLDIKMLRPAKMYFTVTTEGKITDIRLDYSCGYSNIDIDMIELLTNTSGKWTPAQNGKGEKIEQELVVSYGMVGC